jgi:hypothetical protein
MKEWMHSNSIATNVTGKTDTSTVRKTLGYLFSYNDSMLFFESSKYQDFALADFFLFSPANKDQLRRMNDPRPWINSISGLENSGKRLVLLVFLFNIHLLINH